MMQNMNLMLLLLGQFVLKILCSTVMVFVFLNWCLFEYKFTKFHEQSVTNTGNDNKIIQTWIAYFSFTFWKKSILWIRIKQQVETSNWKKIYIHQEIYFRLVKKYIISMMILWMAPGKELRQDGSVVYIWQGSWYTKVHFCSSMPSPIFWMIKNCPTKFI